MGRRAGEDASQSADGWVQSAVRYLARLDRTAAQVEQFLTRKGASPLQARRTVSRLIALRYLNDRAYAERWIASRLASKPMSSMRLTAELVERGIGKGLAETAVRQALNDLDEDALARRAVAAKRRRGHPLSALQMARLLRQRGFEDDTIERIIGERQEEGPDR